ncbi:SLATT domain-containing protein [Enterobacter cloacae complex sp. Mu1197]|uniref:SLATT domain-containing protein n=1 Tax=Enterobacter cloacae complex sp. Mu1197 TaxID=3152302 RepID=A0AAU7FSL7_9ENTR
MATIPDISTAKLLAWNEYKDKTPDQALPLIYANIEKKSKGMCSWYWLSIRAKRNTSLAIRGVAFILLVFGTTFPILSALFGSAATKLVLTQVGAALLIIATLFVLADRVFGWSSGWMRYIATVTTMENLTRAFELEWANYIVSKITALDAVDVKALFELAKTLEAELTKLQAEETTKWITEFNTSIALLESMIKSQREETDKRLDAIRTNLTTQAAQAQASQKAALPGAIEVSFVFKAELKKVKIAIDLNEPVEFFGHSWSELNVSPGKHKLSVEVMSNPPEMITKVIDVQAETTARTTISFET